MKLNIRKYLYVITVFGLSSAFCIAQLFHICEKYFLYEKVSEIVYKGRDGFPAISVCFVWTEYYSEGIGLLEKPIDWENRSANSIKSKYQQELNIGTPINLI